MSRRILSRSAVAAISLAVSLSLIGCGGGTEEAGLDNASSASTDPGATASPGVPGVSVPGGTDPGASFDNVGALDCNASAVNSSAALIGSSGIVLSNCK